MRVEQEQQVVWRCCFTAVITGELVCNCDCAEQMQRVCFIEFIREVSTDIRDGTSLCRLDGAICLFI